MKTILLILFVCPLFVAAQDVQPVISQDYLSLIKKDTVTRKRWTDSSNSLERSSLRLGLNGYFYNDYFYNKFERITVDRNNRLQLYLLQYKKLTVSGWVTSITEIQRANHTPDVQQEYVQGRSLNGKTVWQGPETNELFSYGPAINTLEFDGTSYPYDANGKLTAAGSGNGKKIIPYSSSVFRTAASFSNNATVQLKYKKNSTMVSGLLINAGHTTEKTFINFNQNNTDHFAATGTQTIKSTTLTAAYSYTGQSFSNSNRGGFLNRVYQNALLTPVSFDNGQGNTLGAVQRSYSQYADNPLFLLQNNDHSFSNLQKSGSLNILHKLSKGSISLFQSFENLQQNSNEGYRPSTAFFENGIAVNRNKKDRNYFLNAAAEYNIRFNSDHYKFGLRGTANLGYIYNNNSSSISYPGNLYQYHRSSSDILLSYLQTFECGFGEAGIRVTDKMYTSSTTAKKDLFLPGLAAYSVFSNLFNIPGVWIKLKAAYNQFNSELPINTSLAQNNLTQYRVAETLQYLPVKEVTGFNGLMPIEHREYNFGTEWRLLKNRIYLVADWYTRYTLNDVFPVYSNNQLQLMNLASHRNRGMDLELTTRILIGGTKKLSVSNSFTFSKYRGRVTEVKAGYDFFDIAGFADVHKAIVKGAPLGAIVGNSYLKDAAGNTIIGTDGFPMVNNTPSVIGDPTPDFVIKNASTFDLKKWRLSIIMEWQKGGDVWNGTEALLDYYGRSAGSAALRNTTGYVFNGVDINGKANTIPVSFYDPSLPVEQNRWTRYGIGGVAASYIQKADHIRLNNINLSYQFRPKKYVQQISCALYASNFMLWSAYKGVDPNQLLFDQAGTRGLDLFNLPSYHSFGFSLSLKF
ncbi:SusC/RagA family TonB-linked outer membrane protein [Ferruginibacter sp.]